MGEEGCGGSEDEKRGGGGVGLVRGVGEGDEMEGGWRWRG